MSEFIYQNTARIKGPILLERARIEELSHTLNNEWIRMETFWNESVEELAKKQLQEHGYRYQQETEEEKIEAARKWIQGNEYKARRERQVVGQLEGDRSVKVETLDELLRRTEVHDNRLVSIRVEWHVIDVEFTLDIARYGDEVSIDVRPKQGETSRELFAVIRQWARAIEPSLWMKIWVWAKEPAFFIIAVCLMLLVAFAGSAPSGDKGPLVDKVETLLENGVDPSEQPAALELLLRLESGKYGTAPASRPIWPWIALTAAIVGSSILAISPSTIIGVGPGEQSLKRWRNWGKFVYVSTPAFIVTSILSYMLSKIMDGLFNA